LYIEPECSFRECKFIDSPFKELQNTPEEWDESFIETLKISKYGPSKGIYEFKKNLFPKDSSTENETPMKITDGSSDSEEEEKISFLDKVRTFLTK
jgi:hypothetical protein